MKIDSRLSNAKTDIRADKLKVQLQLRPAWSRAEGSIFVPAFWRNKNTERIVGGGTPVGANSAPQIIAADNVFFAFFLRLFIENKKCLLYIDGKDKIL